MSRIVLILNTADEPSETFQRALAVDLAEDGHEVVIYAISGDLPPDGSLHPRVSYARLIPSPRASGALVAEVLHRSGPTRAALRRARARWGRGRRANSAALGVARLAALEPEVIHLGFSGIGASLADVFDIWDAVPVVVSCRGSDELVRPSFDADRRERLARIFQRATIVHCVADAVADAAIDLGAPETSVRVVRPAVDLDRWVPAPRPAPGPPWRLVSTTRLVPAKGTEDLLAAMAMLIEGGTEVTLEVIGSGPHRDALRLRAMRTGIADRVEFAGAVAPDEVRRRLRGAHLYVSPSLSEGISN
ncbi:MAG: glycosyltransferase family 4 protein, partial [Acidimicrobiales bacterium]|nr:glycosyltransferase family 4 protein [Acidimicrobiales bacterium]